MKFAAVTAAVTAMTAFACAPSGAPQTQESTGADAQAAGEPRLHWTASDAVIVPADASLHRAEDGVALADGTLLVADQLHGLIALSPDGSKRPFGDFASAGYRHAPPDHSAGPNGVAFEPDGLHVLVADIFTGAIYRVDVENETTDLIYAHAYGVNTAHADSTGAIWFTQSTQNAEPNSEARMFAAADRPLSDGALYRIAPAAPGAPLPPAELKVGGLDFANGFIIDESRSEIYVAETLADRINGFKVSLATGEISARRKVADVFTPDNIEADDAGRLWIASPMGNEILIVDPDSGKVRSAFHPQSEQSDRMIAELRRRADAGESRLELVGPELWGPMPGLVTGVILTPHDGPIYISNLGNALVRLDR